MLVQDLCSLPKRVQIKNNNYSNLSEPTRRELERFKEYYDFTTKRAPEKSEEDAESGDEEMERKPSSSKLSRGK